MSALLKVVAIDVALSLAIGGWYAWRQVNRRSLMRELEDMK